MPERIPKSVAIRVPLQAFLASDHVSPATGVTIVVTISKNGGAYGNPAAGATNATEIANGSYYVDLGTGDTDTVGPLFVRGAVATMDPITVIYNVVAFVDQTGDSFARIGAAGAGLTAVGITSNIKKNQALAAFAFLMTDSTNHTPAAGLVVTVTRSIDGGAFAAGTLSAVTEIANGIYSVDFGAGDLNGKIITLKATAALSDTTFERIVTQP